MSDESTKLRCKIVIPRTAVASLVRKIENFLASGELNFDELKV